MTLLAVLLANLQVVLLVALLTASLAGLTTVSLAVLPVTSTFVQIVANLAEVLYQRPQPPIITLQNIQTLLQQRFSNIPLNSY